MFTLRNAIAVASLSLAAAHCSQPVNVPNCPAGQVLSANGREFQCVPATSNGDAGALTIPNCATGQVLTSSNGVFSCVTVSANNGDGGAAIDVPQCAANEVLTAMGGALRCVATASGPGLPSCAPGEVLTASDAGASCVRPITVPTCGAGQVLGVSGGALVCVTPSTSGPPIPTCGPGELLVASDGGFACESATSTSIASQNAQIMALQASVMALQTSLTAAQTALTTVQGTVTTMQTNITSLTSRVAALESAPRPGVYVGNTSTTVRGDITDGITRGLPAAASRCRAEFGAGAHMCTVEEIHRSVSNGTIAATASIARAWVYSADGTRNNGTPTREPTASLHNNCAGYTYPTADTFDTGTAFEFSPWAHNGVRVAKFFVGGTDAACNRTFPIACCR